MAEFTFPHPLKAKTHSLFKIFPKINSNDLNFTVLVFSAIFIIAFNSSCSAQIIPIIEIFLLT